MHRYRCCHAWCLALVYVKFFGLEFVAHFVQGCSFVLYIHETSVSLVASFLLYKIIVVQ